MEPIREENIALKPLVIDHAQELFQIIDRNRDHLRKFLGWVDRQKSADDSREFIKKTIQALQEEKEVVFEIWFEDTFVGLINFHEISKKNRSAKIGYWIDKAFEGKGIITNACKLLFKFGFEELNLNRIEIYCNVENSKSSAVPKRLGCTKEGIIRQSSALYNGFQDMELWSILRSEYKD